MSGSIPKPRNRYKVAEAKQQMRDKIGSDEIEIETDDGSVFTIPHPMFYDAATKKALKPLADDDMDGIARVLFGEDQYAEFIKHDGDVDDLAYVFAQVQEDTQDALAGRKRPTRS